MNTNKAVLTKLSLILTLAFPLLVAGCDVEQTRDGELPGLDVDVRGDPGHVPAYDVEGPDVDMSMEESMISVPDVDVDMEEKTVKTPNVDVTLPDDE